MSQLPLYQCHKKVRAAEIVGMCRYADGGALLVLLVPGKGTVDVVVDHEWLARNPKTEIGGFFVEYQEGDGYTSFSPAAPFVGGYTLIPE